MAKSSKKTVATVTASPAPAAPEKAPVIQPVTSVPEQASSPAPKKGNGKTAKDVKAATPKGAEPHPLRPLVEAAILAGKATALSSACQAVGISMAGSPEERKDRLQAWLDGKPVATVEPPTAPAGKPVTEKPAKVKVERAKDPNALSKPQIKILTALRDASKPIAGSDLAKAADVDPAALGMAAGYKNPEINARPVHARNLLNRGYVNLLLPQEGEGRGHRYEITPEGLAALRAALGEPEPTPAPAEDPKTKKAKKAKTK